MKPFSLEFNAAVMAMASRVYPPGYDIGPYTTNVALKQVRDLSKIFGVRFAERYKPNIIAEVLGQALHGEVTGAVPRTFDTMFLDLMGPAYAAYYRMTRRPAKP